MWSEVLCHLYALEAPIAKDLDHPVVWVEEPLVMGVLQVVQLDISPEQLGAFNPGGSRNSNDGLQLGRESPGLAQACVLPSCWHCRFFWMGVLFLCTIFQDSDINWTFSHMDTLKNIILFKIQI